MKSFWLMVSCWTFLGVMGGVQSPRAWGNSGPSRDLETVGDILQIALPLSALISTLGADPKESPLGSPTLENKNSKSFFNRHTLGLVQSYFTGLGLVYLFKVQGVKLRPDRASNRQSFPSGHTFSAFSGAFFIQDHYGPVYGIPTLMLAALTGYSRVKARAHYLDDVLAGAAMAYLSNRFWNSPQSLSFQPMEGGGHIQLSVEQAPTSHPSQKLSFLLGPQFLNKQLISWKEGQSQDLAPLAKNKTLYTARLFYAINFYKNFLFSMDFSPLGQQIESSSNSPFSYMEIQSTDLGVNFFHRFLKNSRIQLNLGLGVLLRERTNPTTLSV